MKWLAQIEDLFDGEKTFMGKVFVEGRESADWVTVNETHAPGLLSSGGRGKVCPICGSIYSTLWNTVFFADPQVEGRPLIITSSGIFVREDEAVRRSLRKPAGAFKPTLVRLRPNSPVNVEGLSITGPPPAGQHKPVRLRSAEG
jgi:hypothetical protein